MKRRNGRSKRERTADSALGGATSTTIVVITVDIRNIILILLSAYVHMYIYAYVHKCKENTSILCS